MTPIIVVKNLSKTYSSALTALDNISLEISAGEILALLGPNGAGKTTLISTICGIVNPSSGKIFVDGFDAIKDYRKARQLIGLVPQELVLDSFETVLNTLRFSRGLFGKPKNDMEISDYVLQNFDEDEMTGLVKITNNITDSISILVDKKLDLFSSTVNNK